MGQHPFRHPSFGRAEVVDVLLYVLQHVEKLQEIPAGRTFNFL
jgi:hypothetical protein